MCIRTKFDYENEDYDYFNSSSFDYNGYNLSFTFDWENWGGNWTYSGYYYDYFYNMVPASLRDTVNAFGMYLTFVFGAISLPGNFLILLVLGRKRNRSSTTSLYLISLAVADILGTIDLFYYGITFNDLWDTKSLAECIVLQLLRGLGSGCSSWLLVAISAERLISVCVPHKVKQICTRNLALVMITVIWLVFFVFQVVLVRMLKYIESETAPCSIHWQYIEIYYNVLVWLMFAVELFFPYTFILISSIIIVAHLFNRKMNQSKSAKSVRRDVTLTMLVLNCVFLVTNTPYVSVYMYNLSLYLEIFLSRWRTGIFADLARSGFYANIFIFVRKFNHAFNFYVYFLSGSRFRQELKLFFVSLKNK